MNKDKRYYLKRIKKCKEEDEVITATGIIVILMGGVGSAALAASGSPDAGYVLTSALAAGAVLGIAKCAVLLRKSSLEDKLDKALDPYELIELYRQINEGNIYEMVDAVNKLFDSSISPEEIVKNTRLSEEQIYEALQCFSKVDYEYVCGLTATKENALSVFNKHELSTYDLLNRALEKCKKEKEETKVEDDRIEYFEEEIEKLITEGKNRFVSKSMNECEPRRLLIN